MLHFWKYHVWRLYINLQKAITDVTICHMLVVLLPNGPKLRQVKISLGNNWFHGATPQIPHNFFKASIYGILTNLPLIKKGKIAQPFKQNIICFQCCGGGGGGGSSQYREPTTNVRVQSTVMG